MRKITYKKSLEGGVVWGGDGNEIHPGQVQKIPDTVIKTDKSPSKRE